MNVADGHDMVPGKLPGSVRWVVVGKLSKATSKTT